MDENVFARNPSALLELFLLLQQNPELEGVSAYTIGSVKRNLHLIDDEFRQNPRNQRLFLDILRAPEGVTHELRRMNRYGVLAGSRIVVEFRRLLHRKRPRQRKSRLATRGEVFCFVATTTIRD